MFANTQMFALKLGFPDVCKTLVALAVVPIPYPNMAFTSTAIPNIFNQFISCMPVHNMMTTEPTSTGDESGLLLGAVSQLIKGPSQHLLGSVKVFRSVMPATKMLAISGHNGIALNIPGSTLTPSQVKVLHLS
ncbi:hypothetical protein AB835_11565 [Candidatus Endobugula sertula]|uniref:Uncharacterized protein n=1 Tax=Candidatus Endobugula sertula TaxID=62101 RepID=A0A1D2QMX2_9GAMM|nr:hypothetical protein AB835_11565 [Candidatus Endobugula sertula]